MNTKKAQSTQRRKNYHPLYFLVSPSSRVVLELGHFPITVAEPCSVSSDRLEFVFCHKCSKIFIAEFFNLSDAGRPVRPENKSKKF